MIDAYATEVQYERHLRPVWDALPEEIKGTFWLGPRIATDRRQCPAPSLGKRPGNRVLVASYGDERMWLARRIVDMNHGAGQSYGGSPESARHPSYAGGDGRGRVDLFLVPGSHPAQRCRERWSSAEVVEIGCPALDRAAESGWLRDRTNRPSEPVVVVSFHWENPLVPETRSGLAHFRRGLPLLARAFPLLGHCHPRAEHFVRPVYESAGIPWASYGEAMSRADVVVVDNSSLGFEAAACGKAVVWMTSPGYRDLPHGLRFGPERAVGVECRSPENLIEAVEQSLSHTVPDSLLDRVYTHRDGDSAIRAAWAIAELEGAGALAARSGGVE